MKRILGVELKNRVRVHVGIEKELFDALKKLKYPISDFINVVIEKELNKKKRR